jgi:hypothetical protein
MATVRDAKTPMMQSLLETFPFLAVWLSTSTPALPSLVLVRWAQPVLWGVVMAGVAAQLLARQPRGLRCGVMVLAVLWMLLPGAWSPAWWLGLAFRLPSLVTVLLCASVVWTAWRRGPEPQPAPVAAEAGSLGTPGFSWLKALALAGGALLLADMFILLPFSLYRWGFSSAAFGLLLAAVLLAWLVARNANSHRDAQLAIAALALFALTRLPSGNVFDALIDPWLWLVLLAGSLRHGVRKIRSWF